MSNTATRVQDQEQQHDRWLLSKQTNQVELTDEELEKVTGAWGGGHHHHHHHHHRHHHRHHRFFFNDCD